MPPSESHLPSVTIILEKHSGDAPKLVLEEIIIGETKKVAFGESGDLDKRSEPAAERFCVLALHTFLVRTARRMGGSPVTKPHVPARFRRYLLPLWESKTKGDLEWKTKVFGRDPFRSPHPYLEGSGSRNSYQVWIPEEVDVQVKIRGDASATDVELVRKLIERTAAAIAARPDKLSITLKSRSFEVSSDFEEGFLYRGARLRVVVTRTFETHLVVLWINSENRITTLYSDAPDHRAGFSFDSPESKEQTLLIIPSGQEFQVSTPPGIETCLVLDSREPFHMGAVPGIIRRIEASLNDREASTLIAKPQFRRFPLREKEEQCVLRHRLEVVEPPDTWQQALIASCSGISGSVCVFDVPNR
jgi:hypothetical protein